MEKKLVTIHSTSPGHTWIQEFEAALIKKGVDATTINSFHRCLAETGNNFNEATQLFERLNTGTRHEIHLLLAPEQHKHYLRSIADTTYALTQDENALAVYDMDGIPDSDDFHGEATVLSVGAVLRMWNEKFHGRIFSREDALQHLQKILPMREERRAAARR